MLIRYPQDFFNQHKDWEEFKEKARRLRFISGDMYDTLPKTSRMMKDQNFRNFMWFVNFELSFHLAWRKK